MGVYSLALGKPIKQAGFSDDDAQFAGAQTYSEWKFVYNNGSGVQPTDQAVPGAAPGAGSGPSFVEATTSPPAAAPPATPLPSPKQQKSCDQIARTDASACTGQEQRFGDASLCWDSARARADACAAGEPVPPLRFRYF